MKKLLFLFCAFFALNLSAQQQSTFDSRLLFRYEAEFLENLYRTNPSKLDYLNFYVENSYSLHQLVEIPAEKLSQFPDILELINLPENFEISVWHSEKDYGKLVLKLLFFNDVFFQDETSSRYKMLGLKN